MSLKHLGQLVFQGERTTSKFGSSAHLCILTDETDINGPLTLAITDLAHTCLSNYFNPNRHACVSWVQRYVLLV